MAEYVSPEYRALLKATDKMTSEIAADPITVAAKLMSRSLIPPVTLGSAQLLAKEKETKASEIVTQICTKVDNFPENFEVFLEVLDEFTWLKQLADWIRVEYKKITVKENQPELQNDNLDSVLSPHPAFQDECTSDQGSNHKAFPYLDTANLSKEEHERLIARLNRESGKMQDRFAVLVDKVRESLEIQKISCKNLKVLVSYSQKNRLYHLFNRSKNMTSLFLELQKYWSFFDYEFLGVLIRRHCPQLRIDFNEYESNFKQYCERRICEVPIKSIKKDGKPEFKLHVKCDKKFNKSSLKDVKEVESRLSDLLKTTLYLLGVEEGCVKLIFDSLCDITFTLTTPKQAVALKKMGIVRLYTDTQEYFNQEIFFSSQQLISESELSATAEEVEKNGKFEELVDALEMSNHLDDINGSVKKLLAIWQMKMLSSDIEIRPFLIYQVARIGMQDLHKKLLLNNATRSVDFEKENFALKVSLEEKRQEIEKSHHEIFGMKTVIEDNNKEMKKLRNSNEEKRQEVKKLREILDETKKQLERLQSMGRDRSMLRRVSFLWNFSYL